MPSPLERFAALALALLLALPPLRAAAEVPAPRKVAVVITQSVGVGPLADRLGGIAASTVAAGGAAVLEPAAASAQLRAAGGADPLTCGSDARCLDAIGRTLGVQWILAVGIGRFGGMYGLDLRLVEIGGEALSTSGTWAEPGPDWEVALREALAGLLPPSLRAPEKGRLIVRSNRAGTLFVDGEAAGEVPLESPVELAAGTHEVVLRGPDGSARGSVEVEPGALAELELALAPAIEPAAPARWTSTARWIGGGATVALLAGAVATHLSAASTMDDARTAKEDGRPFASTRADALDQLDVARILYGGALALALGTAGLFYFDHQAAQPPAAAAP